MKSSLPRRQVTNKIFPLSGAGMQRGKISMTEELSAARDEMNTVAMDIIMQAGDARLCVSEALKAAVAGDYAEMDKKLDEAKKKIAGAHGRQTQIIQSEGEGNSREHTLLFIHAQDTLMTVYSEMNMARQLKPVFERLENKIAAVAKIQA
jgi:PTS system cellobiose-specific IIA component